MISHTPYSNLDPHLILSAVESVGFICTGGLIALNSYENRVYQIDIENASPIIAKFYRPLRWTDAAILEEHQFALELNSHEIPVVAPWQDTNAQTLHQFQNYRFAIFPRFRGRALELDHLDQLAWMGRFIGRLHAVGACKTFNHRATLSVETHGYNAYRFLIENNFIPSHLKDSYCHTVLTALKKVENCFEQTGPVDHIRLHGDLHAGNVLWNDEGPHIVDLDDCMLGPAIQDIWMLLAGDERNIQLQLHAILRGYREFHHFNPRELHLIEALRTLRMLNYSAWIARRWNDPAFPICFPWFNTINYWQEQLIQFNDQIEALDPPNS